jgi:hypothetical protein
LGCLSLGCLSFDCMFLGGLFFGCVFLGGLFFGCLSPGCPARGWPSLGRPSLGGLSLGGLSLGGLSLGGVSFGCPARGGRLDQYRPGPDRLMPRRPGPGARTAAPSRTRIRRPLASGLARRMAAVVAGPADGVGQQLVGIGEGLEPGRGRRIVRLGIRVHALRGLAVGAPDLPAGCARPQPKHLVGIVMATARVFHASPPVGALAAWPAGLTSVRF